MDRLTDAQKDALANSYYSSLENNYCCHCTDFGLKTLRSLERRGYLRSDFLGQCFWLTGKGIDARYRLIDENCQSCGEKTHRHESACTHCGKIKEWVE